jgi:hypothetical protein
MGSLGEVDHGKEMFHGHGSSDPVVDELNRLQNLLRGLFFYVTQMHAYDRSILVGLISAPSSSFVMLHFVSITPVTGALCNMHESWTYHDPANTYFLRSKLYVA